MSFHVKGVRALSEVSFIRGTDPIPEGPTLMTKLPPEGLTYTNAVTLGVTFHRMNFGGTQKVVYGRMLDPCSLPSLPPPIPGHRIAT